MRGFVDLHCHWIAAIDDGVRTTADGVALLRGLHDVGFDIVVATPHMRPGMFDNDKPALERAFAAMCPHIVDAAGLPDVHLASEHFLDDVVFARLVKGSGLPYPMLGDDPHKKRGALVEFHPQGFPAQVQHRLFDLARAGIRPVIAHPERYQPVWKDDGCLDPLLDAGACLLLDVCSLVGKYGRAAQRAAEKLVEEEAYEAACSDAHRPDDVAAVRDAIAALEDLAGKAEAERLLRDGPRGLLGL